MDRAHSEFFLVFFPPLHVFVFVCSCVFFLGGQRVGVSGNSLNHRLEFTSVDPVEHVGE